jgi:hypothetical protein
MNTLLLLCLILFVIYICIICLLSYYFLKHRSIWDNAFPNILKYIFTNLECPKHCILPIPNIIYTSTNNNECILCHEEITESANNVYQLELLRFMYSNLATLATCNRDNIISNKIKILKDILEYAIRNYNSVRNARIDLFQNMLSVSLETNNNKDKKDSHLVWAIEDIPLLEQHAKSFSEILSKLQELDMDMISSTFILGFIIELQKTIMTEYYYIYSVDL